jgi:hypothetical protein
MALSSFGLSQPATFGPHGLPMGQGEGRRAPTLRQRAAGSPTGQVTGQKSVVDRFQKLEEKNVDIMGYSWKHMETIYILYILYKYKYIYIIHHKPEDR